MKDIFKLLKITLYWTTLPIFIIVIVFGIDYLFLPATFKSLGIIPRDFSHLSGILFAPFIHANLNHLVGNIISLWTLLLLLVIFYKRDYWFVLVVTTLLSGLLTWTIASVGIHIGSSGVIYGLAAFIVLSGFIQKRFLQISASLMVFFAYRYLITGLFPPNSTLPDDISYSSHWSGVISGIAVACITAYFSHKRRNNLASKPHD
ncbi:hypothetical protein COTS27_00177 [Spirochaetota bacterium]|nr:hypothetical protein COTS27_00177 [Spirochaetota bacterium]